MSLKYYTGEHWIDTPFYREHTDSKAILVGSGPSLNKLSVDSLCGPGKVVFGLNNTYPKVRPDIWLAMDDPHCYNGNVFFEPFIKILRGGYHTRTYKEIEIWKLFNIFYADVKRTKNHNDIFNSYSPNMTFIWQQNSFATAIHIILWMGFKDIYLAGCDFSQEKGIHHDPNIKMSEKYERWNNSLYERLDPYLKWLSETAKPKGINFYSISPGSKINEYLKYISLDALNGKINKNLPKDITISHPLDKDDPLPSQKSILSDPA